MLQAMKLVRCGVPGTEVPGVELADGMRLDVSGLTRDFDESFFAADGITALKHWVAERGNRLTPIDPSRRIGCPIARPSKIICIGLNYRDHAAESGMAVPSEPVIFFKSTTALAGPDDDVVIPRGSVEARLGGRAGGRDR